MIYYFNDGSARFCNTSCLEEYEQDLKDGFDYESVYDAEIEEYIGWEEGSVKFNYCCYCCRECS